MRQLVPGLPIDLTGKFEDQTKDIMDRLKAARNGDKRLDTSEARTSRSMGMVIQALAEQLPIRTEPRSRPLKGGTAVDTFEGEVGTVNLADHTPSGSPAGTAWSYIGGGATNHLQVLASGVLDKNTTSGGGVWHLAPTQSSVNQYIKGTGAATPVSGVALCNRSTDQSNQFFNIIAGTNRGLWKIDSGSPTQLASMTTDLNTDEVQEYQVDGNAHEVFIESVSKAGPVSDSFNSTVKTQGLRSSADASPTELFKDMEIGILGAAAGVGGNRGPFIGGGVAQLGQLG
ncbi:MAG: hypothetical protein R3268_09635 [Acidiferrobacterales bacterium]|nr:hypothetical protein [Acidiferrobacterales bacterium]